MYNVAPYLTRCLESAFNQIDINIQVIIVNDGSTDESLAIAVNYLNKRESTNAIIISQKNRGLSAARNIGVSFAVSEYIAFLDTDDFMAPDAYTMAYNFATKNDLDLVLFRSMVFDSFNLSFSEFYDTDLWDSILDGRPNLITNSFEKPELLMLEPNANTRLIRRMYLLDNELFFPVGLVFEDYPIHVKAILRTEKIGLLGSKLYMYRTNRPGKITEEKSTRRFDSLQIFDQTVNVSSNETISPEQGMHILYSLIRLTYWCGTETVLSDRMTFFSQLSHKLSSIPSDWIDAFNRKFRNDIQIILLCALRKGEIKYLLNTSVGSRQIFKSAFILIQQQCYRAFLSHSFGYLRNTFKILQQFHLS
jgi:glycosyltransferase involved in cell wall biosynthesis